MDPLSIDLITNKKMTQTVIGSGHPIMLGKGVARVCDKAEMPEKKVFFDASYLPESGECSVGAWVKGTSGQSVAMMSMAFGKVGTSVEAERVALLEALKLAQSVGEKEIVAVTDCQAMASLCVEAAAAGQGELCESLSSFEKVMLVWVPRERNWLADMLAGRAQSGNEITFSSYLESLVMDVPKDKNLPTRKKGVFKVSKKKTLSLKPGFRGQIEDGMEIPPKSLIISVHDSGRIALKYLPKKKECMFGNPGDWLFKEKEVTLDSFLHEINTFMFEKNVIIVSEREIPDLNVFHNIERIMLTKKTSLIHEVGRLPWFHFNAFD